MVCGSGPDALISSDTGRPMEEAQGSMEHPHLNCEPNLQLACRHLDVG